MDYSMSLITNRADCQVIISQANKDRKALVYRKLGIERQQETAGSNNIEAELSAATAEVSALETVVAGLPEGPAKEKTVVLLTKAQYQKFLLEQRKSGGGSIAMIDYEYNIACTDLALAETDSFISALTARLEELPAA